MFVAGHWCIGRPDASSVCRYQIVESALHYPAITAERILLLSNYYF